MRTACTLLLLAALAAPAAADDVQTLVDDAAALYERADLAGALAKLEAAYALRARPDILFGIARIHVDRGDCVRAIATYRRFLDSKPGPRSTQIATEKIAECQLILARSAPPAPRTRTIAHPWYTDVAADVLVVGGVAAGAASLVLVQSARSDVERANAGGAGGVSLATYMDLRDRADRKERYGLIAGGVGAALVIAGIVKYAVSDRTEVVPVATTSSAGVALGGTF